MSGPRSRPVVIGVGNAVRGDDAAGRAVARRLREMACCDADVVEGDGEATALLAHLEGTTSAYLIDASASGAAPGTVQRFDVSEAPLPQRVFGLSTHGFGLAEALELGRALGQLPSHCVVYAIEGASFDEGAPLSPAVERAVDVVAGRLRTELEGRRAARIAE